MYTQDSISQLGQRSRQAKKKYNILQGYITKYQRKDRPAAIDATNARAEFRIETNNLFRLLSDLEKFKSPTIINYDHLVEELTSFVSKLLSNIISPNELNSLHNVVNLIKEGGFARVFGILVYRNKNLKVRFSDLPYVHGDLVDLKPEQIESLHKDLLLFGKDLNDLIFNIQTTIKILNYSHKKQLITKTNFRSSLSKAA